MNERIQELFHESIEDCDGTMKDRVYSLKQSEIEKFAELIVRECIQTLRDNTPVVDEHDSVEDWDRGYIRGIVDCEHHIKEHFGVEE